MQNCSESTIKLLVTIFLNQSFLKKHILAILFETEQKLKIQNVSNFLLQLNIFLQYLQNFDLPKYRGNTIVRYYSSYHIVMVLQII